MTIAISETNRMRAITQAVFGSADILQLREVPKPSASR